MKSTYHIFLYLLVSSMALGQSLNQFRIAELDSLAKIAYYESKFDKALMYSEKMLAQIQAAKLDASYLGEMNYVAVLYLEMDRYEEAEQLYQRILRLQKEAKGTDNELYIQGLGHLAYCYYGMGRYEEAEPLYLTALELGKRVLVEEAPAYASNLNNLALLYNAMGRNEEAEQLYLEVIKIDKRSKGSKHYYATSLNNLAVLYHQMKRYQSAKKLYFESQAVRKLIYGEDHPNFALGLNNIATLYEDMNQHFEAEEYHREARRILGKENTHYVYSLNASAQLYFRQKRYEEAKKLWLEALKISEHRLGKKHPGYAQYLDDLARVYWKLNQLDTAWNYCLEGLAANSTELGASVTNLMELDQVDFYNDERAIQSLMTLVEISRAVYEKIQEEGSLALHYEICKVAMRMNERIRNDFSSSSNKLRVLAQNSDFVHHAIRTALDLGSFDHYTEAFAFAEQNKSVLLADALKGQRARIFGDLPDSLALKELALQQEKETLRLKQLHLDSPSEKGEIASALNTLNIEIDGFMKSLKDKFPQYHQLKYENITAKAEEVQVLLDDKTLLLEYFLSKETCYLFVVSKKTLEIIPIKSNKNRIHHQVSLLRKSLSNYELIAKKQKEAYQLFTKSSNWLYRQILAPALVEDSTRKVAMNKIENLIIVTDGELGHIPFEVFLMDETKQEFGEYSDLPYLVKKYAISYNYSASLWKENRSQTQQRKQKRVTKELLAFAATYPKNPQELKDLRPKHLQSLRVELNSLPAAEGEVKALSRAFKGKFLRGTEANETIFKKLAGNYSVIHLAMHGILHPQHPMFSSLAFSEDFEPQEDNFLQAYEISQLELNADLVVLSACHTGYGAFQQGEGIVSLARSFMYAGVPSLVVSLWQVNDQSTAIIMSHFYQNLVGGMTKSQALRQAKLSYLETYTGLAAHPALWSAFIQLGDSRAIELKTKNSWLTWVLGGAVFLLGIAGMMFLIKRKFYASN